MNELIKWMDKYPGIGGIPLIPILLFVAFIVLVIIARWGQINVWLWGQSVSASNDIHTNEIIQFSMLEEVLFNWTKQDCFTVRDLLNGGCLVLGRAGSGKTSSSGRTLMQAIVDNCCSGGLILAAKPDDPDDVKKVFRKANRSKDLLVFGEHGRARTNFLGGLRSPRDAVQFIVTLSEVNKRGEKGGGDSNRFYDTQEERTIYNAVAAIRMAGEPLTFENLHKFIMTAPTTQAQMSDPNWLKLYHPQAMHRAYKKQKTLREEHDFGLLRDFWNSEWALMMDAKTRGNILAGVQGTLHTMNTGIVREMVSSSEPNCSAKDALRGKWILVNFPPSTYGAAGMLISVGWKHLMELAILERHAEEDSPFVTIWVDESHQFATNFDAAFICQCRSHKGNLVNLTQSVSSFYSAMKGEAGKHQADALLANFSHCIVHACDPVTAKWAAAKLGRKRELFYGGGSQPREADAWDEMFGQPSVSSSFSEHYEQVLQDQEFMVGRTGGPGNNFIADSIVLKSGEPFSNGQNYIKRPWSQK